MSSGISKNRFEGISLFLCTISLCIPAFINQFPFVFSDSATYIGLGFSSEGISYIRPLTYGLFLRHVSMMESFWLVIFTQAFMTAWFIKQFGKMFFPHRNPFVDILIVAILAATTSIGITTGLLMPDFTTALMMLATCMLLFVDKGKIWTLLFSGLMIWFATACHHSHAYILFFLLMGLAFVKVVFRLKIIRFSWKRFAMIFAILIVGYFSIPTFHYVRKGEFVSSKSTNIFLVSRMYQLGLLQRFLEEKCPTKNYSICQYSDARPRDFLWDEDSPVNQDGGWVPNNVRYAPLVKDFFQEPLYLKKFAIRSFETGVQQFFNFNAVHLDPMEEGRWPHTAFEVHMPELTQDLERSRQFINLWNTKSLDLIQRYFVYAYMLILIYLFLYQDKYLIKSLHRQLAILILLGLLCNAFFCSGISMLADRFQARVIWLVPLFSLYLLHHLWIEKKQEHKALN